MILQIDAARTSDDELVVMHVRELQQLMPQAPRNAQVRCETHSKSRTVLQCLTSH